MFLILLEWLMIFLFTIGFGILGARLLSVVKPNLLDVSILGFFLLLLWTTFFSIFYKVGMLFFCINFTIVLFSFFWQKEALKKIIYSSFNTWKDLQPVLKFIILLFAFLSLMQSATKPFTPDNETYYIQTIKWLNEYGLVPGLANLHMYLAQMSGWHILQSALNISFRFPGFLNDINGYLFIVFFCFAIHLLQLFRKTKNTFYLVFSAFSLASLFIFQFINSPSPDLPIFIVSQYLFYLFYKLFKEKNETQFYILFIGSLFLILVKVMVFPILILPAIIFFKWREIYSKKLFSFILLSLISLFAFAIKNYIISGYPLHPLPLFSFDVAWKIPLQVVESFNYFLRAHAFSISENSVYESLDFLGKLDRWFFNQQLNGIFNKAIVFALFTAPFLVKKVQFKWLLFYCVVQFIVLCFTSPLYRFFFHLLLFLVPVISVYILQDILRISQRLLYNGALFILFVTSIAIFYSLFIGFSFDSFTNNKLIIQNKSIFYKEQIVKPHKNSANFFEYKKFKVGNLEYNAPIHFSETYLLTGDCPLPCVSKQQISIFIEKMNVTPQWIDQNDPSKGFRFKYVK